MNWVPHPPQPICRLFVRADGRFGYNDPTLWPQVARPGSEYLACIQKPRADSWYALWHGNLDQSDCEFAKDEPEMLQITWKFTSSVFQTFNTFFQTATAAGIQLGEVEHSQYYGLLTSARSAFRTLRDSRQKITVLQAYWVRLCRFMLEIAAYMDYHTVLLPMVQDGGCRAVEVNRIGVVVATEEMAVTFFKMGIPVWVLRSLDTRAVFESKMKYSVEFSTSPSIIERVSDIHNTPLLECDGWSGECLTVIQGFLERTVHDL